MLQVFTWVSAFVQGQVRSRGRGAAPVGSRELVTVSLVPVVGLAVATGLVYLTGEPAEELVERAPWFRDALEIRHEEVRASAIVR